MTERNVKTKNIATEKMTLKEKTSRDERVRDKMQRVGREEERQKRSRTMLTAEQTKCTSSRAQTASPLVPHTALFSPTPGVRYPTDIFSCLHMDGCKHV